MPFQWDEAKNRRNIEKHGISLEEAQEVFNDECALTWLDERFEYGEARKVTLGLISLSIGTSVVVVVIHTDRNGTIRIISARRANRDERKRYERRKIPG